MKKEICIKVLCNDTDVKKAVIYLINHVKKNWYIFLVIFSIILATVIFGINNGFQNFLYFILLLCFALTILFYIIFYIVPNSYVKFYRNKQQATYFFRGRNRAA